MLEKRSSVLIFGPEFKSGSKGYGAGKGGVATAVNSMLEFFDVNSLDYFYCSYEVREYSSLWLFMLPIRFARSVIKFIYYAIKVKAPNIHLVADGGLSIFRTAFCVLISKGMRKNIVVDVRGNTLQKLLNGELPFYYKFLWRITLSNADYILAQSKFPAQRIGDNWKKKLRYHPNWININEFPERENEILAKRVVKIIFVGYCYASKGVFDVIDACLNELLKDVDISLHFIGQEEKKFSDYLDRVVIPTNLEIIRHGVMDRGDILKHLATSDVFLFPSYHKGEGHPNVINEAMASKLAIVCTAVGTIDEILDDSMAYFVSSKSPSDIAEKVRDIVSSPDSARRKVTLAYKRVTNNFGRDVVLKSVVELYSHNNR